MTLDVTRPTVALRLDPGPIEQLVLQPTPFCNLDCKYCYLPNRSEDRKSVV